MHTTLAAYIHDIIHMIGCCKILECIYTEVASALTMNNTGKYQRLRNGCIIEAVDKLLVAIFLCEYTLKLTV